eukprot:352483-Chlamydomonas_euryale.AAC.3
MMNSPNVAMDLRIQRGPEYLAALGRSVSSVFTGTDLADVQARLEADFKAILAGSGLLAKVLEARAMRAAPGRCTWFVCLALGHLRG